MKRVKGPLAIGTSTKTQRDPGALFRENRNASIRRAAQSLDIHRDSLSNILRYFLDFHPYKISLHQLLTENSILQRVQLCQKMMQLYDAEPLSSDEIIFSDEANFWFNGYVNEQTFRFCGGRKSSYI